MIRRFIEEIRSGIAGFRTDESGNVVIIVAIAMPVLIGFGAIAAEGGFWLHRARLMQDAADSAVISAAVSNSSLYNKEALDVASKYGFFHSRSNVLVLPEENVTCPAAPDGVKYSKCYRVTIESVVPLLLSQVVGYQGNRGEGVSPGMKLTRTAVAARGGSPRDYCIIALGQAGVQMDVEFNGSKNADLEGCGLLSNEGMNCNGASAGFAMYADSPLGDPSGCGKPGPHPISTPPLADPYKSLGANITTDPYCPDSPVTTNNLSASTAHYCGTTTLAANLDFGNTPAIVTINNGNLDLNGFSLTGSALTIIFTGKSPNAGTHTIVGSKTGSALHITAPTSGAWKGIALYQDPDLRAGVNFEAEGNKPVMDITGVMYMPNAHVVLKGAINKDASPRPCFVMVVGSLTVSGGGFFADGQRCEGYIDLLSAERARLVI
jgi:hypothetical protein